MKLTIEPTGRFEAVSGVQTRMWKGTTERGVEVELYVALVRARSELDQTELEQALESVKAERQLTSFDTRLL
jgi:hypothetical protein